MDLTFQVPMQYCSLQHWTLLLTPVTSTTGYCFCFGSIPSFFLELFLHWSPVAYWAPPDLRSSSSVSYLFAFSYCSWGSQGKNTEVVCHSLLQWTTFCEISPPWPSHLGWRHMAWLSFTEFDKLWSMLSAWLAVVAVVSVCLPTDALSQRLLSYLGSLALDVGSPHGCSSKAQPPRLALDEGNYRLPRNFKSHNTPVWQREENLNN